MRRHTYTVEPLNNGHGGDEHFVHCSEVVPSSEVYRYVWTVNGSLSIVYREVLLLSECPLLEGLLYTACMLQSMKSWSSCLDGIQSS